MWSCANSHLPCFLASGDHRPGHSGGGVGAGLTAEGALPSPAPPSAGDPAGPAPAAQHSSPVPAADVCSPAAAPHAADGGLAAAAPQQRPAPEPGGRAAGETEDAAKGSEGGGRCPAPPTRSLTASSWNPCEVGTTVSRVLQQVRREALGGSDLPWGPQSSRAELALLKEGLPAACLTTTPHLREGTEGARRRPQEKAVTHAAHLSALSG